MMHVLETAGIPGAGKSTVSRMLVELLQGRGLPVLDRDQAVRAALRRRSDGRLKGILKRLPGWMWHRFIGIEEATAQQRAFLVRHGRAFALVLGELDRTRADPELRDLVIRSFLHTAAEWELVRTLTPAGTWVVWDEGPAQRASTSFGYLPEPPSEGVVATFTASMPSATGLVALRTDPEVALGRHSARPRPPDQLRLHPPEQQRVLLARAQACLDTVADIQAQVGVPVLILDGGGSAEVLRPRLSAWLDEVTVRGRDRT